MKIKQVIFHYSFGHPKPTSNDIALLKLVEPVELTDRTPACLPSPGDDFTGRTGSVYGIKYEQTDF